VSRYKAYSVYEKSRVEWADITPKHWGAVHLRWIANLYAGGTPSKAIEEYWENGSVPWINSGEVNQGLISEASTYITEAAYKNSSAKWIPKNALVMALAGQGKTKGMIAQLAIDATCNQSMAAIVPNDLQSSRYLFWWLCSNYQNIRNMAGGDLRDGLNLELLGDIGCPIPNKEEQKSIASFLDYETAKIDTLIEKQQRLIELLKEKRQAVISRAVTKGLNPNAPMKDSGVEWLGEVPAHWEVATARRFLLEHKQGYYSTEDYVDDGVKLLRITDLRDLGEIDSSNSPRVKRTDTLKSFLLRKGDVVFARTGGAGSFGVVPDQHEDLAYASYLIRFRFAHTYFSYPYLRFMFASDNFQLAVKENIHGGVNQNLHAEDIKNTFIAVPPIEEQEQISTYLSRQSAKYSHLIAKAESTVELMQERRTSLISAAVTGKIDVRDWQASA
jgi:type I restriction enzyme, S subunit